MSVRESRGPHYDVVVVRQPRQYPEIEELLAKRRRLGLDACDEVWEGVLHVSPPPHDAHGLVQGDVYFALQTQIRRYGLGRLRIGSGVRQPRSGRKNFRVPDLTFLRSDQHRSVVRRWIEVPVALVVEIRSPREVVRAKLPFYAARQVEEVLWIGWETLEIELHRLSGDRYIAIRPDKGGFLDLESLAIRLRRVERAGGKPGLELIDARGGGPLPPV